MIAFTSRQHCAASAAVFLVFATAACGAPTDGNGDRVSLVPRDASVAQFDGAEVVVRGASLEHESYAAHLGSTPVTAGRSNDSTLAFVVPDVPAGQHHLSVTIGTEPAEVTFSVVAAAPVADPVAYTRSVESAFESGLAAVEAELAANASFGPDATTLAADFDLVRGSFAAARAEFDAMSPDEQREAAVILQTNYDLVATVAAGGPSASIGLAANLCDDPDLPLTVEEAEACESGYRVRLSRSIDRFRALFRPAAWECEQDAERAARRGLRPRIRTFLLHIVNGCHYAQYSAWSYHSRMANAYPTTPEFADSPNQLSAALWASTAATVPHRFTFGAPAAFTPAITFRPMIAADIGRVPEATTKAALIQELHDAWTRINTLLPAALRLAPVRLESVTSAPSRQLTYPAARLKLGAITPSTVTGAATASGREWTVKFDANDRTSEIPFTFDVIYDGGRYGTDTVRMSAILGDSVPVYEAAAVGRWVVTYEPPNGDNWDTYHIVLSSEAHESGAGRRKGVYQEAPVTTGYVPCPWVGFKLVGSYCEAELLWNVYPRDGRYVLAVWAPGSIRDDSATPLTMPITEFSTSRQRYVKE
jgi:hypothetical protein